ncbi:uncharacterized protein CBL_13248 [Carabus blaptoides fortunei]
MSHKCLFLCLLLVLLAVLTSYAIKVDPGLNTYHTGGLGIIYAGYDAPVLLKKPQRQHDKEQQQDFSKIPGVPGHDYPIYHSVPPTSFSCEKVPFAPGMYANVETGCQAYHICHDGREGKQGASFLCTNGTLFNQKEFSCDWWYNVNCAEATHYYNLNLDPLKNPYLPKPKVQEVNHGSQLQTANHHEASLPTYIHVV